MKYLVKANSLASQIEQLHDDNKLAYQMADELYQQGWEVAIVKVPDSYPIDIIEELGGLTVLSDLPTFH